MMLFKVFIQGILYFLSCGENPVKKYEREFKSKGDAERISEDWKNVGNDIRNAYEKYQSAQR